MNNNEHYIKKLLVHGQGVVVFKTKHTSATFRIISHNNKNKLEVFFTQSNVFVKNVTNKIEKTYIDQNNKKGLISNNGAYYWFSLDSQNQIFYAGIGEPRIENKIYEYKFNIKDKEKKEKNKKFLESLDEILYYENSNIKIIKILKYPVSPIPIPFIVKSINQLTMMDIAKQTYMPLEHLSPVSQKLYNSIGGSRFVLNDDYFPEFSQAIEYSISTEGCWCNTKIKEKSTEFNPNKPNILETYLRITMGMNNGDSPGQMLVMEIWPKGGHYSPIHSHANCQAIIRVLHGSINVSLYPYLCGQKEEIQPFAIANFQEGDVTWISPTLNQVHKLKNLSNENTCITIQCYEYDQDDTSHYDYFDYINETGKIMKYEPDSDCDFIEFKELIKQEWRNHNS